MDTKLPSHEEVLDDVAAIARIDAVATILEVVCRTTGMGFAAVARVTADRWVACAVRDEIQFGLEPGGELAVATTICRKVWESGQAVVIDHVAEDEAWCGHPTPKMYGFESYISVPIRRAGGELFGTLCAIDPKPAKARTPQTIGMFTLFADLIAAHLDAQERLAASQALLSEERQAARRREDAEKAAQHLAAIVESSADAILAKDLQGTITSWNRGAERLFGYTAAEAIGRPVTILMPPDRLDEEPGILAAIRAGESVDQFDTVRRRKDGSLIDISLTVSPIRNRAGEIVGASKIARDMTERRRSQEQQGLLLREMSHRFRNLIALAGSIVALSARSAATPEELAEKIRQRLEALARAHALTLPRTTGGPAGEPQPTTLGALIQTILSPYGDASGPGGRVTITGCDATIAGGAVTGFALLLHELATNAAKYGSLGVADGVVEIDCASKEGRLEIRWRERGGPAIDAPPATEGFGTFLSRVTVEGQFGGEITRAWDRQGLTMRLSIAEDRL